MSSSAIPRLLVAGVSSGVGKTTVTVALARALRGRGLRVALFKCGPDYLDPTYHTLASGVPSHNLDGWMMGREAVIQTFATEAREADVALIEGMMGLFDGRSAESDEGSCAEIARFLSAPVLLVADASGIARSVAALAQGFARFDPRVSVAGLFCNRVGSAGHLTLLSRACGDPPVLGGMIAADSGQFPSRHLGLLTASQTTTVDALDLWAQRLMAHTDVDRLLTVARAAPPLPLPALVQAAPRPRRCRLGVAQDHAFSFYYPYNLRLLEALGAELVPFSPLEDPVLPEVDGVYLGGGYPELHAAQLSENVSMRESLRAFARGGRPVYAECGGLMYLSEAIVGLEGRRHEMVGLVRGVAVMQPALSALGYVEVETRTRTIFGDPGLTFRGHQFRYSRLEGAPEPTQYTARTRMRGEGFAEGYGSLNVLATYVHAHWASNPVIAEGLIRTCEAASASHGPLTRTQTEAAS